MTSSWCPWVSRDLPRRSNFTMESHITTQRLTCIWRVYTNCLFWLDSRTIRAPAGVNQNHLYKKRQTCLFSDQTVYLTVIFSGRLCYAEPIYAISEAYNSATTEAYNWSLVLHTSNALTSNEWYRTRRQVASYIDECCVEFDYPVHGTTGRARRDIISDWETATLNGTDRFETLLHCTSLTAEKFTAVQDHCVDSAVHGWRGWESEHEQN